MINNCLKSLTYLIVLLLSTVKNAECQTFLNEYGQECSCRPPGVPPVPPPFAGRKSGYNFAGGAGGAMMQQYQQQGLPGVADNLRAAFAGGLPGGFQGGMPPGAPEGIPNIPGGVSGAMFGGIPDVAAAVFQGGIPGPIPGSFSRNAAYDVVAGVPSPDLPVVSTVNIQSSRVSEQLDPNGASVATRYNPFAAVIDFGRKAGLEINHETEQSQPNGGYGTSTAGTPQNVGYGSAAHQQNGASGTAGNHQNVGFRAADPPQPGGYMPAGNIHQGEFGRSSIQQNGGFVHDGGHLQSGVHHQGGGFGTAELSQPGGHHGGYMTHPMQQNGGFVQDGAHQYGGYGMDGSHPYGGHMTQNGGYMTAEAHQDGGFRTTGRKSALDFNVGNDESQDQDDKDPIKHAINIDMDRIRNYGDQINSLLKLRTKSFPFASKRPFFRELSPKKGLDRVNGCQDEESTAKENEANEKN